MFCKGDRSPSLFAARQAAVNIANLKCAERPLNTLRQFPPGQTNYQG